MADVPLPLPAFTSWPTFPFEGNMRVKKLDDPVDVEPPRHGEDPAHCGACRAPDDVYIWVSERWRVRALDGPTGLPMVLILESRSHLDLGDLPNLMAAELGVMTVRLERAIRSLDGVARVQVNRWGDGSAHLHVWFLARPYGRLQLRGTFLSLWDDILPRVPEQQWRSNLALVAAWLAEFGGRAVAEPPHIDWKAPARFAEIGSSSVGTGETESRRGSESERLGDGARVVGTDAGRAEAVAATADQMSPVAVSRDVTAGRAEADTGERRGERPAEVFMPADAGVDPRGAQAEEIGGTRTDAEAAGQPAAGPVRARVEEPSDEARVGAQPAAVDQVERRSDEPPGAAEPDADRSEVRVDADWVEALPGVGEIGAEPGAGRSGSGSESPADAGVGEAEPDAGRGVRAGPGAAPAGAGVAGAEPLSLNRKGGRRLGPRLGNRLADGERDSSGRSEPRADVGRTDVGKADAGRSDAPAGPQPSEERSEARPAQEKAPDARPEAGRVELVKAGRAAGDGDGGRAELTKAGSEAGAAPPDIEVAASGQRRDTPPEAATAGEDDEEDSVGSGAPADIAAFRAVPPQAAPTPAPPAQAPPTQASEAEPRPSGAPSDKPAVPGGPAPEPQTGAASSDRADAPPDRREKRRKRRWLRSLTGRSATGDARAARETADGRAEARTGPADEWAQVDDQTARPGAGAADPNKPGSAAARRGDDTVQLSIARQQNTPGAAQQRQAPVTVRLSSAGALYKAGRRGDEDTIHLSRAAAVPPGQNTAKSATVKGSDPDAATLAPEARSGDDTVQFSPLQPGNGPTSGEATDASGAARGANPGRNPGGAVPQQRASADADTAGRKPAEEDAETTQDLSPFRQDQEGGGPIASATKRPRS